MENVLYITYVDYRQGTFPGVEAKIAGQCKTLTEAGYHVDRINQFGSDAQLVDTASGEAQLFKGLTRRFALVNAVKAALSRRSYGAAYIRFQFFSEDVRQITGLLKKSGAKVLMEIPTYPYEGELHRQGLKGEVKLFCDRLFRRSCAKNMDAFVILGEEKAINGVPCLRVLNGLDYEKHPLRHVCPAEEGKIHLLAVASMLPWHGYDRVLEGMADYYDNGGTADFTLHLVGDGKELPKYRQTVSERKLEEHVIFHGMQGGEALTAIADGCHIALGSLAAFRIGIRQMSTLKSREYCAWGFPTVNATDTDILDREDPYCLFVPEDESPIDMAALAAFHHRVYFESGLSAQKIAEAIREKARSRSDVSAVFRPVVDFIKGGSK